VISQSINFPQLLIQLIPHTLDTYMMVYYQFERMCSHICPAGVQLWVIRKSNVVFYIFITSNRYHR